MFSPNQMQCNLEREEKNRTVSRFHPKEILDWDFNRDEDE